MKIDIEKSKKNIDKQQSLFSKIYSNSFVQIIFTMFVGLSLICIGLWMMQSMNPTETSSEIITISERQVLSRNYYVVTPDNEWWMVGGYNNTYSKLQPGHTYNVIVRQSIPRQFDTKGMTPDRIESIKKIDMDTRFGYTGKIIIGINEEIK